MKVTQAIYSSTKGFKQLLLLFPVFAISILISGCQATGSKYVPLQAKSDAALIYIYRPNTGLNGKAREYPEIFLNGSSLGILKAAGYMVNEVTAGKHEVRITGLTDKANWSFRDIKRTIKVKPNSQNYFRLLVSFDPKSNQLLNPGMDHLLFLTPVDPDDAIYEIKDTHLSE